MITEKQLQSQGYIQTNRTAEVATYERNRPFAERFFKGLLAALCTITVIPLFFMERAVKQMWAEAFSPVDRKIVAIAKDILPSPPSSPVTTAALPPIPPVAEAPPSRITSIYGRPLADRSSASTAAGGAGAASSTAATIARKERIICLNPSAAAPAEDLSAVSSSLIPPPPEDIGPLNVINRLCARLMTDKNEVEKQAGAVKQELDLLVKYYVERSSKLPKSYKEQFEKLSSFEERLEYLVVDDPNSRSIIEQIIAAFERIEKQQKSMRLLPSPSLTGLVEVGEALKHCLNNNLFTAYQKGLDQGRFLVINTDEFQYPLVQSDFARDAGRDEVELEEDLVFLIYLNRCPSLAKADIDSRFDGELTRVEGILNSKGVLSSEDKETLNVLRENINLYMGENSLLNKRLMARLQEGLESDLRVLINDREMSATDKLNKIFEEFYPTYFPERLPVSQELAQALEQGCFELLMSGIDLSRVSKNLRDAFLEHLQDVKLYMGAYWGGRDQHSMESGFLKIAKEHPEYFRHLRSLKLGSTGFGLDTGIIGHDLYAFLATPEARRAFPHLEELQLNPNRLFNNSDPSETSENYLLRIIQNISNLKVIKLRLVINLFSKVREMVPLDYDALKSDLPGALGAEVNLDVMPFQLYDHRSCRDVTITIGERTI